MRFFPLKIPGAYLIEPEPHSDARGVFTRKFCAAEFAAKGLEARVVQANLSENFHQYTLRGFHYQREPHREAKTISVIYGMAQVVCLDLRPESETYLAHVAQTLDGDSEWSVHVPAGCAAAFLTLEERTVLHYYSSGFYHPDSEMGARWDDPLFGVKWPHEPAVISDKDKNWPDFVEA